MQDKINLLKNTQLFSRLNAAELEVLAIYSDIIRFKDKSVIFNEGSKGESLFIVKTGKVRIIKKTEDEQELDIAEFIEGELFGEHDLFEEASRNASAIADQDTSLLVFPGKGGKFAEIIGKHTAIFANILHELIAMTAHRIRETNKLVSEKTKWIEELRNQLLYDKLTGLYNRSYLTDELTSLLPELGRHTGILFIKPDNFKYINDTFGHNAGDEALLALANTIKANLEGKDIGVRYRGDEFIAILPDNDINKAIIRAEKIKNDIYNINIRNTTGGQEFHFYTSIGLSIYPDHAEDTGKLTELAFNKMMEIRNSGGNKVLSVI
ncbi:MAG: GGDEF domain-containing protein [Spirochaetes bacterium]|nr:GGDEF domain-containing protein [Spirochaetota bacterium]